MVLQEHPGMGDWDARLLESVFCQVKKRSLGLRGRGLPVLCRLMVDGNDSSGFNPPRGKLPAPTSGIGEEECIFRWRGARVPDAQSVETLFKRNVIRALGGVAIDNGI
jgi:hypothetical protein